VAPNGYYRTERFEADRSFLSADVRLDKPLLGDIAGLRGIHLQCHIGTDTISLSRLGARMTGLDYSSEAVAQARALAARVGANVDFIESDVYDAPRFVEPASFDLVYSNLGSVQYLPRIRDWARVVAALLRPGGRLFMRECHPVVWSLRDVGDDRLVIDGAYFERPEPERFDRPDTYAAVGTTFATADCYEWNHGLGEIVSAILDAGLRLTALREYDTAPARSFYGMEKVSDEEYRLIDRPWRLPLTYTLEAYRDQ
jgi:SAM-dependent methyltransferase